MKRKPEQPPANINGKQNPEYRKWYYEQKEAKTKTFRAGSEEAKAFYAENMRRARRSPVMEERRIAAIKASKKVKEASRRTQKMILAGLGMKMHPEIFSIDARENHVSAAVFSIRSPEGIPYRFKNLHSFVRDNTGLFEDGDATWFERGNRARGRRDITCHACNGIRSIKPSENRKKVNGSWKGWTWVTIDERAFYGAEDHLNRT